MKDRESAERKMKQSYSVRVGESSDKFATVETRRVRDSNDEKANKCSPTTEECFPERRREEEEKTFSNEGYARSKFASINETDRHRRGEKTSSNSDGEEFEQESRDILYRLEKQSHLAHTEDTRTIRKPTSYSNGDEQTWRSLARVWRGILANMLLDRTIRGIISNLPVYCLTVSGMLSCRTR